MTVPPSKAAPPAKAPPNNAAAARPAAPPAQAKTPVKGAPAAVKPAAAKKPVMAKDMLRKKQSGFFAYEPINIDFIANEDAENRRMRHMQSLVFWQSVIVAALCLLLIFLAPFMRPIYHYAARDQSGNEQPLDAMLVPNMTDQAVLSWSVNSVTEIMTFGFGDVLSQVGLQKARFTPTGWDSFVTAFQKAKILETFKNNQLVLTTVPSDTAVILSQGPNLQGIYQWKVQVPVIMNYVTNNNVPKARRGLVTLTIVRVPPDQNIAGIAIKNWLEDK
jgi:hypothetical protein